MKSGAQLLDSLDLFITLQAIYGFWKVYVFDYTNRFL